MKFLTLSISVLALMAPVTFITNASIAQSTRPTNSPTNLSPQQPKPNNSLKIKNATKEPTKGKTETCKGGLYSCQKFITACEAQFGSVSASDSNAQNIPQKYTCTLP